MVPQPPAREPIDSAGSSAIAGPGAGSPPIPAARRRWDTLARDPRLWAGSAILASLVAVTLVGGLLAPYDPHALSGRPLERPGAAHPLGTNDIGQDILSQVLQGGRGSLLVGVAAATLSTALAWLLGLLTALGPLWRAAIGGAADLFLALPFLPLVILIIAHFGPGLHVIAITLGLTSWPAFTRVMRARVSAELAAGYVEAARATGAPPGRILWFHLLPATVPVATAKFVLAMQAAIVVEASLAFLGLGDPLAITWGGIIHSGVGYGLIFASGAWRWWLLPPCAAIGLLVSGVALIGWALDDASNPT